MKEKKSDFSRREFLSGSTIGLASAGVFGVSKNALKSCFIPVVKSKSRKDIIHRTLGKTLLKLPIVNMGVMNADNPEVVKRAYESGIRLFDTASIYQAGKNEEMIGKVVKQLGIRDKVYIMTKTNSRPGDGLSYRVRIPDDWGKEEIRKQFLKNFDGCLKRLQTNYADILLCHGVRSADQVNDPGIREAFIQIKKDKKANFVGMAAHSNQEEVVNAVIDADFFDVVLVSFNITMSENEGLINAMKKAADKGIGVIAMKTQAGGRRRRGSETGPVNHTAALKWVMRNEFIATSIPGFTTFEQLEEDFSIASDLEYSDEEKKFLSDKKVKFGLGFCQQCEECKKTCPKNTDIPTLMRTHMYASQYSNFDQARFALEEIPAECGLKNCETCVECIAKCVNSINIPKSINELKMLYV